MKALVGALLASGLIAEIIGILAVFGRWRGKVPFGGVFLLAGALMWVAGVVAAFLTGGD